MLYLPLVTQKQQEMLNEILTQNNATQRDSNHISDSISFFFQKARLARIRIAKASSGAAFVSKKKAAEARLAAQESGLDTDDGRDEDIFELQHHHLLRCLEKTTVSYISHHMSLKKSVKNFSIPFWYTFFKVFQPYP